MPGVMSTPVCPALRKMLSSSLIESVSAFSLIGSTMPLVPRTEIPPSMPSLGLKVLLATASPCGMLTVARRPTPSHAG